MSVLALSTGAREILPQNTFRRSLVLTNEDTAIDIYLKVEAPSALTVSSTDHEIRLSPGAVFTLNQQADGLRQIVERWTAIAASGTPNLALFETEDLRR